VSVEDTFEDTFESHLKRLPVATSYETASDQLFEIIQKKFLAYDDVENDPEKFFNFHKLLSVNEHHALGIKFTVQYNLFAGTILFLGNDAQRKFLIESQEDGIMGCFALTEKSAGVFSGFVVHTEAVWDKENRSFKLSSIDRANSKVWISQGLSAQYMVVFANLIMDKNYGPHAFLIPTNLDGIEIKDMGTKTSLNALDNAEIYFNNVTIPYSSLLSRFTQITSYDMGNEYKLIGIDRYSFITIAQKLITGRFCIATASVAYFEKIINRVENFNLKKEIYITNNQSFKLIDIPRIRDHILRLRSDLNKIKSFNSTMEKKFCSHIMEKKPVSLEFIEDIAISKIRSTEFSCKESIRLREMIGSQSLMESTGLGSNLDIFYCTMFAEGDNNILKQKITKDAIQRIKRNPWRLFEVPTIRGKLIIFQLIWNMWINSGLDNWLKNHNLVFDFADIVIKSKI